ncbi:MAG: hypothetical protein WED15_04850, partial [Akkermansiaceae bacterium]
MAWKTAAALTSETNERCGRQLHITSFRWLPKNDLMRYRTIEPTFSSQTNARGIIFGRLRGKLKSGFYFPAGCGQ